MKKQLLVAAIILGSTVSSHANLLSGSEIEDLIAGKQVDLATSWGSFPLQYAQNNQVIGDGSGLGLANFFAPKETGKWWVTENRLCQQFPTWYKGKALCFSVEKTSPGQIKWKREDGYAGTATIR